LSRAGLMFGNHVATSCRARRYPHLEIAGGWCGTDRPAVGGRRSPGPGRHARAGLWPHASDALDGADFPRSRLSGACASYQLAANAAVVAAVSPERRGHGFGVANGDTQVNRAYAATLVSSSAVTPASAIAISGGLGAPGRRPGGQLVPPAGTQGGTVMTARANRPHTKAQLHSLRIAFLPVGGLGVGWVSSTRCAWRSFLGLVGSVWSGSAPLVAHGGLLPGLNWR
jgi:hypothetical protein